MINLVQNADGTAGFRDELAGYDVQKLGGPASAAMSAVRYHGVQWLKAPLATVATAGGVLAVANPFGKTVIVVHTLLHITTASTGASTIDMGVAANGTTLSDVLIDGKSGATAGVFDNVEDQGTNGTSRQLWTSSQFVTASQASGDVTGLVGNAYIGVIIP